MKKLMGMVILVLLAVSIAACSSTPTATPQPVGTPAPVKASGSVVAEGKVVPVRNAALSFQMGGNVAELPVAVGDQVSAGRLLARLDTHQLELQVAQAEANLASAQAALSKLKRGPTPEDLAAAQQNLTSAQAAYDSLMHPSANDLAQAKADYDKAKAALDQAQAAFDQVGGDSNPFAATLPQSLQLQSATQDFTKAQAALNAKVNPTNAQIQQAMAAVTSAKDQLSKLQHTADDLATAQANVNAAQAARDLAAEQLNEASLVAPFDGVVTSVELQPGEYAAIGTPVVRIADTSSFQIETTDLTELNIVGVHQGTSATVTFDAIPGLELTGKVTRSELYGENRQGDIVYTVYITPDKQDDRLRWNMTAKVSLDTGQ